MTHASGCLLLPVLLRQGRCVVLGHFDPELLLETIARAGNRDARGADDDLHAARSPEP